MTVRLELTGAAVIVRVYDVPDPSPVEPCLSSCVLVPARVGRCAWLRLLHGQFTDRHWAEVQLVALQFSARVLLVQGGPGPALPGAVLGPDGITRVDLSILQLQLNRRGDIHHD